MTGPADSNYVSNLHSFRLARTEVQAAQGTFRPSQSPAYARETELSIHQPPTIAIDHGAVASPGIMPEQQPDALQAPEFAIYPHAGAAMDTGSELDPAVEEYIRLADEMSNFFTWDASEYPVMNYMEPYDSYL